VLLVLALASAVVVGVGGPGWTQPTGVKLDEIVVQYPKGTRGSWPQISRCCCAMRRCARA
jgi:hypothetical protein